MQVSRNGRGFLWVRHYVFGGGDFDFRGNRYARFSRKSAKAYNPGKIVIEVPGLNSPVDSAWRELFSYLIGKTH